MPQAIIALIGRLLLSAIFIMSGVNKFMNPDQTVAYMTQHGLPAVQVLFWAAVAVELLGGALVVVGFQARIGAGLLACFLVPTTLVFHKFWGGPVGAEIDQAQLIATMKNLAIMGGLLVIAALGPGGLSIDERMGRRGGGGTSF